jgi:steroid delta-isomerase-like uncharacterized protein
VKRRRIVVCLAAGIGPERVSVFVTLSAPDLNETEVRNLATVMAEPACWNVRDVACTIALYHDDITWVNIAMEETYTGKQAVSAYLEQLFTAFPDINLEITHAIAQGEYVSYQWTITGTHLGAFIGIPATRRKVTIPGTSMIKMRDGKFLVDHFYYDSGIIMRQIGLLPSLALTQGPVGRAVLWLAVKRIRVVAGIVASAVAAVSLSKRMRPAGHDRD